MLKSVSPVLDTRAVTEALNSDLTRVEQLSRSTLLSLVCSAFAWVALTGLIYWSAGDGLGIAAAMAFYLQLLLVDLVGAATALHVRNHAPQRVGHYSTMAFACWPLMFAPVLASSFLHGTGWLFRPGIVLLVLVLASAAESVLFLVLSNRHPVDPRRVDEGTN
jgi:hypothetical protein